MKISYFISKMGLIININKRKNYLVDAWLMNQLGVFMKMNFKFVCKKC